MKKIISLTLLTSMLLITTGCVSETLGLTKTDKTDANATAVQQKGNELSTKLDDRTEKKVDGFFDKMLGKAGL
jgi:PBP1b-binding outer membrane lipoprotein LpoB